MMVQPVAAQVNGASKTKTNGGIVMKNALQGFKVFNAFGEVVSYENPSHLVSTLDVIFATIKTETGVEKVYSLPSPVYRAYQQVTEAGIESVKMSFANKFVENIANQIAKVKANEAYEEEKRQRHAQRPLSASAFRKRLYEPRNMMEFVRQEDVVSIEIVTIPLTDRILFVADDKEGYPASQSMTYHAFKYLSLNEIKAQYDMVFFTDRTAFTARQTGQHAQRQELKIVRDYGYGVTFKDVEILNRHLLANAYADDETLLNWLDSLRSKHLVKKQHTVYHVEIKDIEKNDATGRFEYKGAPVINEFASSSHLLETLEKNNYQAVVLNADYPSNAEFSNDRELQEKLESINNYKRSCIFKEGFWMEIDGKEVQCRRILQSSSQSRTIKISFSTCPSEDFWNVRGQISYGLIKEGDNLEPNKAEKRFGLASSTSVQASKPYKALVIDDSEAEIKLEGLELVFDEEKSATRQKKLFKVNKFSGYRRTTPTDGQILASHAILAQLTHDLGVISRDDLLYWLTKTCKMVKIQTTHPSEFPFKVVDCKTMDEIYEMVQEDARLESIRKRIVTAAQVRLNISDKGLAVMFDVKKYWPVIHQEIVKQYQAKGLPVPSRTFDPEMFIVFSSSHKLKTEGIFYDVNVRICNYVNSINHKPEKHRLSTQAFFSLDLPRSVSRALADEEIQAYQRAFNSIQDAIAVTGSYGRNQINTILNQILTLEPTIAEKAFKNSYIQEKLYQFIEKQLLDLQYGQLLVKAETHYITCDPLYFFNKTLALKPRQAAFYDQNGCRIEETTEVNKNDKYLNTVCLIRHPHLNRTEKAMVKLTRHDELWYLGNVLIINGYDDTFLRMGGADVDGDKVMIIFDRRVVANTVFYQQFIQQGISTYEKQRAGMIKVGKTYYYDDAAILEAHNAGTEGTQIADATNTILRMTELFSAEDISPITTKPKTTFQKEIYTSIVQLCCMSGQLIDQAGIPQEERLYMEDYEEDFWGKYPFITRSMVEYLHYKRGIRFDDVKEDMETYRGYRVIDLDTSFKALIQHVRQEMNKFTNRYIKSTTRSLMMNTADNVPLGTHVASHLLSYSDTVKAALQDLKQMVAYWSASASKINLLPNHEDDDKDIVNAAWERLRHDMHELLLSIHPDPRMCAALTYFYCYGTGLEKRLPKAPGLVWNCLWEEFIEYLNPGYSCMYLEAPSEATLEDEVVVVEGALFLRKFVKENGQMEAYDYLVERVGYHLASSKLVMIGNKLCMIAIRPRSVMFMEPSNFIAVTIKSYTSEESLLVDHSYRLIIKDRKLIMTTMDHTFVGQVYVSKSRFAKLNNTVIRVERLACGSWQLKDKESLPEFIYSSALISVTEQTENPYQSLRQNFTKEAIENGLKGYAVPTEETLDVESMLEQDVLTKSEELTIDDLLGVELDLEDDFETYMAVEKELNAQAFEERSETLDIVKGSFVPSHDTVTEYVEEPIDLYDEMEAWYE